MRIRLNEAAFEPMAELRKLTASLLTPTDKSKIASRNRKITTHRNNMSITYFDFCFKVSLKLFHKYFIKFKLSLNHFISITILPATIISPPIIIFGLTDSFSNKNARMIVNTTLSLSIGATRDTSPGERALK